ncbi:MAG: tripartite tricarboxylate transporter TctB family protein [Pseudomonadota bacterium]
MAQRQDIVLGLVFVALGLFMAVQALDYSGATGRYPLALSVALAILGLIVAGKALFRETDAERALTVHRGRLILTAAVAAGYFLLVPVLGFYTASVLIVACLPVALGFRKPVYLATVTVVFTGTVWIVFSLILEKPLPAEIWALQA